MFRQGQARLRGPAAAFGIVLLLVVASPSFAGVSDVADDSSARDFPFNEFPMSVAYRGDTDGVTIDFTSRHTLENAGPATTVIADFTLAEDVASSQDESTAANPAVAPLISDNTVIPFPPAVLTAPLGFVVAGLAGWKSRRRPRRR